MIERARWFTVHGTSPTPDVHIQERHLPIPFVLNGEAESSFVKPELVQSCVKVGWLLLTFDYSEVAIHVSLVKQRELAFWQLFFVKSNKNVRKNRTKRWNHRNLVVLQVHFSMITELHLWGHCNKQCAKDGFQKVTQMDLSKKKLTNRTWQAFRCHENG